MSRKSEERALVETRSESRHSVLVVAKQKLTLVLAVHCFLEVLHLGCFSFMYGE